LIEKTNFKIANIKYEILININKRLLKLGTNLMQQILINKEKEKMFQNEKEGMILF
jgi:hypothetical protein